MIIIIIIIYSVRFILSLYISRYVGPYLALSSELAFVLEDNNGVCGYVLAVLDSAQFYNKYRSVWLPQMINKYPIVNQQCDQSSPEKVYYIINNDLIIILHSSI